MIHLEFGISPDIETTAAWGARGIITNNRLELLWDRQSASFADESIKGDFIFWINNTAIPRIESEIKFGHCKCDFYSADNRFRCVADDHDSGGYVYIGAWALEKET